MADVFISYSDKDRELAAMLAEKFREIGLTVWWDRELLPAERWDRVIAQEVDAASAVVVVWTANSVENDNVLDEALAAREDKKLVPVKFGECRPTLFYRRYQYQELTDWDGDVTAVEFKKLAVQLVAFARGQEAADAAPALSSSEPVRLTGDEAKAQPPAALSRVGFFINSLVTILIVAGLIAAFKGLDWQSQIGAYWASVITLAISAIALFRAAEYALPSGSKALVSRWLAGERSMRSSEAFLTMFEAVFGKRHWTLFCLGRSIVATLFVYFVMLALFIDVERLVEHASAEGAFSPDVSGGDWDLKRRLENSALLLLIIVPITNIIADYISLWQTRKILEWSTGALPLWLGVILDAILTLAVFLLILPLGPAIAILCSDGQLGSGADAIRFTAFSAEALEVALIFMPEVWRALWMIFEGHPLSEIDAVLSSEASISTTTLLIALATTFITSVWLWFALLTAPLFWLFALGRGRLMGWLSRMTGATRRPILWLGYGAALVVAAAGYAGDIGGRLFAQTQSLAENRFRDCVDCPWMVEIPAGAAFIALNAGAENGASNLQRVDVPSFAIGAHEITFRQWDACVEAGFCRAIASDSGWGRGERPVINIRWADITGVGVEEDGFLAWLNAQAGASEPLYRLPTEVEWQYAASAGVVAANTLDETLSHRQANFWASASTETRGDFTGAVRGQTLPVGAFAPNAWGLYDMRGNVAELTQDCWTDGVLQVVAADARACARRVARGGSWSQQADAVRLTSRQLVSNGVRNVGFRVLRRSRAPDDARAAIDAVVRGEGDAQAVTVRVSNTEPTGPIDVEIGGRIWTPTIVADGCRGWSGVAPHLVVAQEIDDAPLTIAVENALGGEEGGQAAFVSPLAMVMRNGGGLTLTVRALDAETDEERTVFCDLRPEAEGDAPPAVTIPNAAAGRYLVWIGSTEPGARDVGAQVTVVAAEAPVFGGYEARLGALSFALDDVRGGAVEGSPPLADLAGEDGAFETLAAMITPSVDADVFRATPRNETLRCPGWIALEPTWRVRAPRGQLAISAFSSDRDLVIAVMGPDGVVRCNDDARGLNPAVSWADAAPGVYLVWAGTLSRGGGDVRTRLVASRTPFAVFADASGAIDAAEIASRIEEGLRRADEERRQQEQERLRRAAAEAEAAEFRALVEMWRAASPRTPPESALGETSAVPRLDTDETSPPRWARAPSTAAGPLTLSVDAGGVSAARLVGTNPTNGFCSGYFVRQPTLALDHAGGPLALSVESDRDTVMGVIDADGEIHCSDDFRGLNPGLEFVDAPAGRYLVWVGTFSQLGAARSAQLHVAPSARAIFPEIEAAQAAAVEQAVEFRAMLERFAATEPPAAIEGSGAFDPSARFETGVDAPARYLRMTAGIAQPLRLDLEAGGPATTRLVGPDAEAGFCNGFYSRSPMLVIDHAGGPLAISAESAVDTVLAAIDGEGAIRCNDDTRGLNPGIELTDAPAGRYLVWLGTYAPQTSAQEALLHIAPSGRAVFPETEAAEAAQTESFRGLINQLVAAEPPAPSTSPTGEVVQLIETTEGLVSRYASVSNEADTLVRMTVDVGGEGAGGAPGVEEGSPFCGGFYRRAPSLVLDHAGGPLAIAAVADIDLVLAVLDPEFDLRCSDDFLELNPGLVRGEAPAGRYLVWVGSYGPQAETFEAALFVTASGDGAGLDADLRRRVVSAFEEEIRRAEAQRLQRIADEAQAIEFRAMLDSIASAEPPVDASGAPQTGGRLDTGAEYRPLYARLTAETNPPLRFAVDVGGETATRLVGADVATAFCPGYYRFAPTLALDHDGGPLAISAESATDLRLAVIDAEGVVRCNDDFNGFDPALIDAEAPAGRHLIWVGTYAEEFSTSGAVLHVARSETPVFEAPQAGSGTSFADFRARIERLRALEGPAAEGEAATSIDIGVEERLPPLFAFDADAPEAVRLDIETGGSGSERIDNLDAMFSGCGGYFDRAPTAILDHPGGPLAITAESGVVDLRLIALGPEDVVRCNDDFSGLNPGLEYADAPAGRYLVWVGTYGRESSARPATLRLLPSGQAIYADLELVDRVRAELEAAVAEETPLDRSQPESLMDVDPAGLFIEADAGGPIPNRAVLTALDEPSLSCDGAFSAAPSLALDAGGGQLTIAVEPSVVIEERSEPVVFAMIVRAPNGVVRCVLSGDSRAFHTYETAERGRYLVWVGLIGQDAEAAETTPVEINVTTTLEPKYRLADAARDTVRDVSQAAFSGAQGDEGQPPIAGALSPEGEPATLTTSAGGPAPGLLLQEAFAGSERCPGWFTLSPTWVVDADAGPLAISAVGGADLTLAVLGPDGTLRCNDDLEGSHPGLVFADAQAGRYLVWVGVYNWNEVGIDARAFAIAGEAPAYP